MVKSIYYKTDAAISINLLSLYKTCVTSIMSRYEFEQSTMCYLLIGLSMGLGHEWGGALSGGVADPVVGQVWVAAAG